MKWFKRFLLVMAVVLLASIASALVGVHLYHGTPKWYRNRVATTQQVKDAANRADQKLLDLFSWVASARAQQVRRLHGNARPDEPVIGPKTISFDDDEINAFVTAWKNPEKSAIEDRISRYFKDGRVVLDDDSLILVGQSPALNTLVSVGFSPSVDAQGNLRVVLDSLRAGLLPVPASAFSDRLDRLQDLLREQLFLLQPDIGIDSSETANSAALGASWLRLLISSLGNEPADPVLIIPFDMTNLRRGVPVKLTAIRITDSQITMTMETLPPDEDKKLLERLKRPPALSPQ